ncbi:MAG: von Willebrand factor type A domain-containing protein [Bacteroidota bacterium]
MTHLFARAALVAAIALIVAACGSTESSAPAGAMADMAPAPTRSGALMAQEALGEEPPRTDREGYAPLDETGFVTPQAAAFSTFSIDVDRASYANVRRMLIQESRLPPADAVRIEEFVNAFEYGLDAPEASGGHPFAVETEVARAPWAPNHHLVRIAMQAQRMETEDLPPLNLVFLLDTSGSMNSYNKLGLLKQGLALLTNNMRPQDRVAIVAYAGSAGLVLPSTSDRGEILDALDRLQAGGSTAGGAGLRLAYATARESFSPEATNRVILATDGDFNVGVSSDAEMQRLIEEERASGVFLSVLGFGSGNLQDSKMETLADHGNGNYAYIDSIREAEKVLVREMGGTLVPLAKDLKVQVEFNPAHVAAYRLIGYENRRLRDEEFNDDTRDAGELGAGHSVTAIYEIVPVGQPIPDGSTVDAPRYQRTTPEATSGELMTVKFRYKPPTGAGTFADQSVRLDRVVRAESVRDLREASEAMRWAVAVTEGAMLLRQTAYAPGASYDHAIDLASGARGQDPHGDRAEFVSLLRTARALTDARGVQQPRASTIAD